MSYTADDYTALQNLIKAGQRRVRFSDGREVEYGSTKELMAAASEVYNDLLSQGQTPTVRQIRVYSRKGF
jgi:hypothetical protein